LLLGFAPVTFCAFQEAMRTFTKGSNYGFKTPPPGGPTH
jgi:hypothetical protein